MKTMIRTIAVLLLTVLLYSCGGGGGGATASIPEGYSMVRINIGSSAAATNVSGAARTMSSTFVPPDVTVIKVWDVRLYWDAAAQIWRLVLHKKLAEYNVREGGNDFVVSLIENGYSIIYVQAFNGSGNLLYAGANVEIFSGGYYYVPIYMNIYTNLPPQFSGIGSITNITANSMTLSWPPATDDITPPNQMQYLVFMSLTPGGENLGGQPSFVSDLGQTSYTVTGLTPNTTYYFVVRAMDQSMNIDSNTKEMSATTLDQPAPQDGPPIFRGLTGASGIMTTGIYLTWNPAIDDVTPPNLIRYLIFMGVENDGGQRIYDFANPVKTVTGGNMTTVKGLQPGTYCFIARAQDEAGNTDSNTVEQCSGTVPLPPLVVNPAAGTICEDNDGCTKTEIETMSVTISGGLPPYSMVSGNPAVIPSALPIAANTHIIDATDNSISATTDVTLTFFDSQGFSQNVTVTVLNEIVVVPLLGSICENTNVCAGGPGTESVSISISGGTPNYTVTSSNASVLASATLTNAVDVYTADAWDCSVPDTQPSTMVYTLYIVDANGASQTVPITVYNEINNCIN